LAQERNAFPVGSLAQADISRNARLGSLRSTAPYARRLAQFQS